MAANQGTTFPASIKVSTNFGLAAAKPLDARFTVASLAILNTLDASICYEGMIVFIEDVKKLYIYKNGSFGPISVKSKSTSQVQISGPLDELEATINGGSLPDGSSATTQPTSDESVKIATTEFVHNLLREKLAAADAMTYKGIIAGGSNLPEGNAGDFYKVSTAGTISGYNVHVGDILICKTDSTADNTPANWDLICVTPDGTLYGPGTSVVDNIPTFSNVNGTAVKDSGIPVTKIGKIMVDSTDAAPGYIDTKITSKSVLATNEYAVSVTKDAGALKLSVIINEIDGGYYDD